MERISVGDASSAGTLCFNVGPDRRIVDAMKTETGILQLAFLAAFGLGLTSCANFKTGTLPMAEAFGTNRDGAAVRLWTLENESGCRVKLTDHGATIVSFEAPDRNGDIADVVLGFDSVVGYESSDNQYFGCTTGRIANRIAGASFVLDGRRYDLTANDGNHQLHGGVERSLDKVQWTVVGRGDDSTGQWIEFTYTSPDGEEGYPGNVEFFVRYSLRDDCSLEIHSRARTDRRTVVALTNHAYWNLDGAGAGTIDDHVLRIPASRYTPADDTMIPTGEIATVGGTNLDFRDATAIGARVGELESTPARGYDHNFVIDDSGEGVMEVARLYSPRSGRELIVESDEPGLQFYTGNWLRGQLGKGGQRYGKRGALCLEPQHFPNSVNETAFPSVVLKPDEEYSQRIVYRLGVRE